jgi:hypothetical protein
VNSIAATTTRTGLTVRAELDTALYETGIRISDGQLNALPLSRHDWYGDWNYTLRPQEHRRDGVLPIPPQNEAGPGSDWLTHPALTGIPHEQWDSLVTELAAARAAQRQADLHQRRGGDWQKTPAAGLYIGRRPGLTLVNRLLATILYQRFKLPQVVIAPLFTVTPVTLNRAISQTRRTVRQCHARLREFLEDQPAHPVEERAVTWRNGVDVLLHTVHATHCGLPASTCCDSAGRPRASGG